MTRTYVRTCDGSFVGTRREREAPSKPRASVRAYIVLVQYVCTSLDPGGLLSAGAGLLARCRRERGAA